MMKLTGGIMILATGLVLALPAAAEPATPSSTAKITASGTFKLTGAFTVTPGLPAKTAVSASFYLSNNDSTYSDSSSITAQATVVDGKVRFSATIPYLWLVAERSDSVTVTLNLSGYADGAQGQLSYTTYLTRIIPLPKNGATTAVLFSGTL
jgi:hypothetical protein